METPKITIYYDGLCRLCSGVSESISKSQESAQFTLKDATKGDLPRGLTKDVALRDVHVVDANGTEYHGAPAVMRILFEYPRWRWLARLGRLPVLRVLVAAVYRLVADTRYWVFGRLSRND